MSIGQPQQAVRDARMFFEMEKENAKRSASVFQEAGKCFPLR